MPARRGLTGRMLPRMKLNPAHTLYPWIHSQSSQTFKRETWEGKGRLLPELPLFGWLHFHETLKGALQPDRHPGLFEIHYLKRGHLSWWIEDRTYDFQPHSIFIVRPGELHGGDEDSLQPCEHFWLRINLDCSPEPLPGLSLRETQLIRNGFTNIQHRTFPVSTEIAAYFERLLDLHRNAGAINPIIGRGLLHAMLGTILRDHDTFSHSLKAAPLVTWRIRRVMELLNDNSSMQIPKVVELAKEVGLSESGFRERFKAETGYSPHEYILNHRIKEARRRLAETSDEITRIAVDLGFASSQYFATVFRRRVGLTPGNYRLRHKSPHAKNGS